MLHLALAGVRLKIDRAKAHLREFKAAVESWSISAEQGDSAILYPDPERNCIDIEFGEVRKSDPMWGLMIGDVFHNLRSALDHMVCQLAILNGQPPTCCKRTSFPICNTDTDFAEKSKRIRPLVSPEAFALIESLQPYNVAKVRGLSPFSSSLWIISELDIIDKHRVLVVARPHYRTMRVNHRINEQTPTEVPINEGWRPFEEGAPIASVDVSDLRFGGEDKVYLYMQTELKVLLRETGTVCDGLHVMESAISCINFVVAIVDEFGARFFSE